MSQQQQANTANTNKIGNNKPANTVNASKLTGKQPANKQPANNKTANNKSKKKMMMMIIVAVIVLIGLIMAGISIPVYLNQHAHEQAARECSIKLTDYQKTMNDYKTLLNDKGVKDALNISPDQTDKTAYTQLQQLTQNNGGKQSYTCDKTQNTEQLKTTIQTLNTNIKTLKQDKMKVLSLRDKITSAHTQWQTRQSQQQLQASISNARALLGASQGKVADGKTRFVLTDAINTAEKTKTSNNLQDLNNVRTSLDNAVKSVQASQQTYQQQAAAAQAQARARARVAARNTMRTTNRSRHNTSRASRANVQSSSSRIDPHYDPTLPRGDIDVYHCPAVTKYGKFIGNGQPDLGHPTCTYKNQYNDTFNVDYSGEATHSERYDTRPEVQKQYLETVCYAFGDEQACKMLMDKGWYKYK